MSYTSIDSSAGMRMVRNDTASIIKQISRIQSTVDQLSDTNNTHSDRISTLESKLDNIGKVVDLTNSRTLAIKDDDIDNEKIDI